METYMMMLYVSIEQEKALKQFFLDNDWEYCKPDLSALTDSIGPLVAQVPHIKKQPVNETSNMSPSKNTTLHRTVKSKATARPYTRSTSVSGVSASKSECLPATSGEPKTKKRKLSGSQGHSDTVSTQAGSEDGINSSQSTTVNLDGTMTVNESEATGGSTVMDSLSEENRSNDDDPAEMEIFDDTVLDSRQVGSPKKKIMRVYKVKRKDEKSIQCEDEESGASKVFKLPLVIKKEIFECEFCEKTFTIQRHLKKHSKREHGEDIEDGYNPMNESGERNYNCDQCNCSYNRISSLKQHQVHKHGMDLADKQFPCDMCGGKFETSHFLDLHQADKHGKILSEKGVEHECKFCGLTFPTFRALRMHKRQHEAPTNHVCEICGKGYLRLDSLRAHHKFVHLGVKRYQTDEKKFVCEICGSRFFRRSNLKEHFQVKHSNEPLSHKCDQCERSFNRPSALEHHTNKVHLKQRKYTCAKCEKMFYSKHSLHDHTTICSMAPEKMVGCEQCGKLFTSQHNYKLHYQAMHSTPALICPCGTVVRWQSSVTKHKRRCSLYNTNLQKGRKKALNYSKTNAVETKGLQQVENVVYLQNTFDEEPVYTEMQANDEGTTTVMVSEAEPDVAESVGKILEAIPQDALQEGSDHQNITVMEEQVVETEETPYNNVSVVTQEGQDSQKIYYVIQY